MIPSPPFDPCLPSLSTLLDGTAMATIVASSLGADVTRCLPRYARYKPGSRCVVRYDLTTCGADGTPVTLPMHVTIFADDRGKCRVTRSKMRRLLQRRADLHGPVPVVPVAYLARIEGLMQIYPIDYELRYLVDATSRNVVEALLREAHPGAVDVAITGTPELLRYKPARKALLRYRVEHGPTPWLYGKVRSDDGIEDLVRQTEALIEAGTRTPPILVDQAPSGFVAHAAATGTPLASLRDTGAYTGWMEPLADSLRQLHSVDVPAHTHVLADELAVLDARARQLGRLVPHLARRIDRIRDQLATRLGAVDERFVTIHGDFYDDQALVSDAGVTLIDLDELRRGHPLLDAGNMLAHLTSGEIRGANIGAARNAFLDAVLRRQRWPESEISTFEAAALLKLAPGPFRRLEPDWPAEIERTLDLAESRLSSARGVSTPFRSCKSLSIADPALPQLGTLQDADAMTSVLSEALNRPVRIASIDVKRHKPGRRAILRIETADRTLFAKTFASARGPRVHEITRTICEARAFGEATALPDPVAYLPELKTLVQRQVEGLPVEAALLGGDTGLACRIATALHRFHISDLDLRRDHDLRKELLPLEQRVAEVCEASPNLWDLAGDCLSRARAGGDSAWCWRRRPIHRDFYHDQMLVDGDRLAVLDLDDAAMSEPAVDVANFAAHLLLLGVQRRGDAEALRVVIDAFMDEYHALDSALDPTLLRFLTGTTLVRLAGIHVTRPAGPEVAVALLERAAVALRR